MPLKLAIQRCAIATARPEHGDLAVPARARRADDLGEVPNCDQNDFLADVSHEMRAPMSAILAALERVLETPLTHGQCQSLQIIRSAAADVVGMLDDLADLSKLEAGELELEPANFFLRATVDEVLRPLTLQAHHKGVKLVHGVQHEVPEALIGDVRRLRQILLNLLDDAIERGAGGEVFLQVERASGPGSDADPRLRFSVQATGEILRRQRRSGLGVAIAGRLISRMGGEVAADGDVDRGGTIAFTLRLPRQPPIRGSVDTAAAGLRALVVDEDAGCRAILDSWLREANIDSTSVPDCMAAMDRLWEGATTGRPYGLLVLDAQMRRSDAHKLLDRIRARSELASTRIILLTAADLAGRRELPADATLPKPVVRQDLFQTIRSAMNRDEPTRR